MWIVGCSAWTNQSETNAEASPATTSSPMLNATGNLAFSVASLGVSSERRYCHSQAP